MWFKKILYVDLRDYLYVVYNIGMPIYEITCTWMYKTALEQIIIVESEAPSRLEFMPVEANWQ